MLSNLIGFTLCERIIFCLFFFLKKKNSNSVSNDLKQSILKRLYNVETATRSFFYPEEHVYDVPILNVLCGFSNYQWHNNVFLNNNVFLLHLLQKNVWEFWEDNLNHGFKFYVLQVKIGISSFFRLQLNKVESEESEGIQSKCLPLDCVALFCNRKDKFIYISRSVLSSAILTLRSAISFFFFYLYFLHVRCFVGFWLV